MQFIQKWVSVMAIKFEKYIRDTKQWIEVYRKGHIWQIADSGETFELFRVKVFAEALDRRVEQLKLLEKKGLLPPPLFKPEGEQCHRWYSAPQIVNSFRIMRHKYGGNKYLSNKDTFNQFFADIKSIWYCRDIVVSEKGVINV